MLSCNIACMPEMICAFVGLDSFEDASGFPPELFPVPHLGFPQPVLELGEHLLDQVEIGAVRREKPQFAADVFNRLSHGVAFVAARVVHDDDISGPERGGQSLLDLRQECFAVDRASDDAGRDDPVAA